MPASPCQARAAPGAGLQRAPAARLRWLQGVRVLLGGGSYLASFFGGTNIIFAKQGVEVVVGAYRWFPELSGAHVVAVATPEELLAALDRELLGAG